MLKRNLAADDRFLANLVVGARYSFVSHQISLEPEASDQIWPVGDPGQRLRLPCTGKWGKAPSGSSTTMASSVSAGVEWRV